MTDTLYFLCTGNSCRSQMAEGWAKKLLPTNWTVKSAGIEAHGLNTNAIKAMAEVGIDISNHTSDLMDFETLNIATLIVTLSRDAADKCPMTPPYVHRKHWIGAFLKIQRNQQIQMKKNGRYSKMYVMPLANALNNL